MPSRRLTDFWLYRVAGRVHKQLLLTLAKGLYAQILSSPLSILEDGEKQRQSSPAVPLSHHGQPMQGRGTCKQIEPWECVTPIMFAEHFMARQEGQVHARCGNPFRPDGVHQRSSTSLTRPFSRSLPHHCAPIGILSVSNARVAHALGTKVGKA